MKINLKQNTISSDNFDHEPWNKFKNNIISFGSRMLNIEDAYYETVNLFSYKIDVACFEEKFDFPLNKIFDIARDGKYNYILFFTEQIGFNKQCFSYIYEELANYNLDGLSSSTIQIKNQKYTGNDLLKLCLDVYEFNSTFKFDQNNSILILINKNLNKVVENLGKTFADAFLNAIFKDKNKSLSTEEKQKQTLIKQYIKDLEQAYKNLDKNLIVDYLIECYCSNDDYMAAYSEFLFLQNELDRYPVKELMLKNFPERHFKCYKKFDSIPIAEYTEEKLSGLVNDEKYFYVNTASGDSTVFSFPNTFVKREEIQDRTKEEKASIEEYKCLEKEYNKNLEQTAVSLFK